MKTKLSPALVAALRAFGDETGLARESNRSDHSDQCVYWQSGRKLVALGLAEVEGVYSNGTWYVLTEEGRRVRDALPRFEQERLFS